MKPSKDEAGVMDEMVTTCSIWENVKGEGLVFCEVVWIAERRRGLTNPVNMIGKRSVGAGICFVVSRSVLRWQKLDREREQRGVNGIRARDIGFINCRSTGNDDRRQVEPMRRMTDRVGSRGAVRGFLRNIASTEKSRNADFDDV